LINDTKIEVKKDHVTIQQEESKADHSHHHHHHHHQHSKNLFGLLFKIALIFYNFA
jgi:hypothetical protein